MVDHALMPGAGAYYLDGCRDHCVVLVHGYTATPGELRLLGDELQQLNFKVMGVRLPGHGTTVQDLAKTTFRDWCDAVESDIQRARGLADQVTLVGSSMGAGVCLKVATETELDSLVVMSAPMRTFDDRYEDADKFVKQMSYMEKPVRHFDLPKVYSQAYHSYPLQPLVTAFTAIREMEEHELNRISCPILIMQSKVEKTVCPVSAEIIYDKVSSKDKELVWYEHSGHLLALGPEREKVYQRIEQFLVQ